MMRNLIFFIAIISCCSGSVPIDNGLADPDIIYPVPTTVFEPKCEIFGKPLDLLLVLDSSGSLQNRFNDSVDVIKRVVQAVAIDDKATRVGLVQYSGHAQTYFHFDTYTRRSHILNVLDGLRSISGITKTGKALNYVQRELSPVYGMRGPEVPKIIFLVSDGRTHDYPDDKTYADLIRTKYPGVQIWAYGTGDYVAMDALINITADPAKIVTNKNVHRIEELFSEWRGTEVCEEVPVCIPGSDQPLDLLFVVDASNSLEEGKSFREQVSFIHRVLNHVNVHPEAVRVGLITFSSQVYMNFNFVRFNQNDPVHEYIDRLEPLKGTTQTTDALRKAFEMFDPVYGARDDAKRMAIVLSDGHAATSPAAMARRLTRLKDVVVVGVAVSPPRFVDPDGLKRITDNRLDRVFHVGNLDKFEDFFLEYVNFGCPGMEGIDGKDVVPVIRKPIEATCSESAMQVQVRTKKPFTGYLYANDYEDKSSCIIRGQGDTVTHLIFLQGDCGMVKAPSEAGDGYFFNVTMRIQFHPTVVTRVDEISHLSCFYKADVPQSILDAITIKNPLKTNCDYTLHEFGPMGCIALDGIVGKAIYHKWTCDSPPNYNYLVHNCIAESDEKSVLLLDDDGCEVDPTLLETPDYRFKGFVTGDSQVFKFPGKSSIRYRCLVSLCDKEGISPCKHAIPPVCDPLRRRKRSVIQSQSKKGFVVSFEVVARRLNVLDDADVNGRHNKYCNGV